MCTRFAIRTLIAVLLLTPTPTARGGTVRVSKINAADRHFQYWGRWDRRDAAGEGAVTVNTGSTIVAAFDGTGATLHFRTDQYPAEWPTLWMQVDDQAWRVVRPAAALPVADKPLAGARHVLRIVVKGFREWDRRWTPPLESSVVFRGMTLSEGTRLAAPPERPKHMIEYLGDSITEGVLTHYDRRQPMDRARWPEYSDGRQGWAYQSALRVGAEPRVVGFGRLGLTLGGNGGVPPAADALDHVHADAPLDTTRTPDVVVVNLGTNDGGAAAKVFAPLYADYLRRIRHLYPDARVLAMRPFNGAHADAIRRAAADRVRVGDKHIEYVDTTGWIDPRRHTSDSVHLNLAGHRQATEKLTPILQRSLGHKPE